MPVHFLTFHAHGSWTPEKSPQRELFQRDRFGGLCRQAPADPHLRFTADHQRKLIDAVIDAQRSGEFRCFGAAADRQRLHLLIAWEDERHAERLRRQIKASVTRAMDEEFGPRPWLSEEGQGKRVRNRTHFGYLVSTFFPKQRGLVWTYSARRPRQQQTPVVAAVA